MNPAQSTSRTRTGVGPENGAPEDFLFRLPTAQVDPALQRLCDLEEERQLRKLILIASESVCPDPVKQVLASSFNNLYTEGYPSWRFSEAENRDWFDFVTHLAYFRRYSDLRYYRGCDYANFAEAVAQKRISRLFATDGDPAAPVKVTADEILANVQPLSGAAANNAVYMALVKPGDTVVGMSLVEGGHLTHGSPANRSGKQYRIHSYGISPKTGEIDYEQVAQLVKEHRPRMLIGGASAYPWRIDWQRLRAIADTVDGGCFLLADVAHYAGLIVAGQYPNPIGYADVVTFTTHKSLCGPRGAVILTRSPELWKKLNVAVFPGEQGGPHQGNIAAKAVAFQLAGTETFRRLMANVVTNAKALARGIERRGVKVCYGGTDSHLCLVDLNSIASPTGMRLTGEIAGRQLDLAGIVVNKNTVRGDRSAVHPSAIRLGTVWVSQLGYDEADMDRLAELITTLLKGAHPFRYIDAMGYVGRGKVDLDVLDGVRAGVNALIESRLGPITTSSERPSGYPHYDAFAPDAAGGAAGMAGAATTNAAAAVTATASAVCIDAPPLGVLEIESERAHYFLQSAGTADLSTLAPGGLTRSFLLDRHGRLVDDVLVLRRGERLAGWRRYLVVTNAARHARVRRWLRALSDGYVLFDEQDVFRKLEGPAMVEDLVFAEPHAGDPAEPAIASACTGTPPREAPAMLVRPIALLGDGAAAVLAKALGRGNTPAPGTHVEAQIAGHDVLVACEKGGDRAAFLILAPPDARDAVAAALRSSGADAAKADAFAASRRSQKLPDAGRDDGAAELFAKRPDLFARRKVYFVGQSFVPQPPASDRLPAYAPAPLDLPLRKTPLFDEHVRLGQKEFMVPFGGWRMPVRYGPILDEHRAVRTAAGLFDVSHMGVLEVRGENAQRFLDAITTNYVAWLRNGDAQYSYLLDPAGGCIDDILVYRRAHDRLLLVVNASNAEKDEAWIRAAASGEFAIDAVRPWVRAEGPPEIVNLKDEAAGAAQLVDLALQGPRSLDVLAVAAENPDLIRKLATRKRFEFVEGEIRGGAGGAIDVLVATTGYTGEKVGFEILVHPDRLVDLWNLLLERGASFGLKPCGLGSRDSTRIEAGFPLWGHELAGDHDVTPIEAGYGSAVKFHKPFFVGRDAMLRHEQERKREIVRFQITGRGKRLVRAGNPVAGADGKVIGVVTSNTQVDLDNQIGLALVDRKSATKGLNLFIYRLPASERIPAAKRMDQLTPGDELILPEQAVVLKRFM